MLDVDHQSPYAIAAVERMALICRQFSTAEPELTLAELADRTAIPVLSVAKIVATLERRRFMRRVGESARYSLGFAWLAAAELKRKQFNLCELASPLLEAIRLELNETITFGARDGDYRVVLDARVSTQPVRRTTAIGFRTPLHVGSAGRSMLAHWRDDEIAAYLERMELKNVGHDTPTDAKRIWDDIKLTRKQGYATATAEITRESFSASAAVFSYSGDIIGALTITCPLSRLTAELKAACIKMVRTNADKLSRRLGFRPDRDHELAPKKRPAPAQRRNVTISDSFLKPVRAVERALDILSCFSESRRHLPLQSIVDETGIHKATAFRFVSTMTNDDLLSILAPRGPYALGFLPLKLADIVVASHALRLNALPQMRRISADLNETVVLCARDGDTLVGIDHVDGDQDVIESPEIGVPRPLHLSPAGRVILARFATDDLRAYLTRQKIHGQARDRLLRLLHAANVEPEHVSNQSVVQTEPIGGPQGWVGALVVSIPIDRATPQLVTRITGLLKQGATQIGSG